MAVNMIDDETKREIQRRKDAAISLGLPRIVEFLFEEIRFYPDWKNKSPENCFMEIVHPRTVRIDKVNGVVFSFEDTEYAVGASQRNSFLHDSGLILREYFLYNANQTLLFSISGYVEDRGYGFTNFNFSGITTYIPGDWTKDILKLHWLLKEPQISNRPSERLNALLMNNESAEQVRALVEKSILRPTLRMH